MLSILKGRRPEYPLRRNCTNKNIDNYLVPTVDQVSHFEGGKLGSDEAVRGSRYELRERAVGNTAIQASLDLADSPPPPAPARRKPA